MPGARSKASRQRIRYLRTSDGVRLAWAEAGQGPLMLKASNWLTHLEYDWESPVWRHWIRFLADHFRLVRFDERGCGMTDWQVEEHSLERWVRDLEEMADAVAPGEPLILLGISQGAAVCIGYAVRHPERVSHLVLYGGYSRGIARRDNPKAARLYTAIVELARLGWGTDNPAFREVFTSLFIPGGTDEQIGWFNDLCRKTVSPEVAARLMEVRSQIDVSELLGRVRTPTLVLHARQDRVAPLEEGRRLAAGIPGAQFVELDSTNHILLEHEPAWERFCEAVLDFVGIAGPEGKEDSAFASLSPREREVLVLVSEGLGNAAIAERLALSDKTVRNHLSNVFDKLGVWTRAQAIVFARDRGFRG
jgi:pimeloyl-ACP methyl ester carboxylesterase/DNA-binding CsgD family transcriptional regulator